MSDETYSERAPRSEAWLARVELAAGLVLTAWAVVLHVTFFLHAGELWRDEISSVNLASLESWSAVVRNHHLDSFPVAWPLLLRAWIELGLGASDASLRALGLCAGIGVVAALWWCARRFAYRVPLVSLALLGLSSTLFLFGDTLRGYGIGVAACIAMIVCTWRVIEDPRPAVVARAAIAAIVGVQCMYPNAGMLLAISIGACVVCAMQRCRRALLSVLAIGVVACVSMLPYHATFARLREWTMIVQAPVTPATLARVCWRALEGARPGMAAAWCAAFALACLAFLPRMRGAQEPAQKRALVFLASASFAACACHGVYLAVLSVPTQAWYYLAPMAVAAVFVDAGVQALVQGRNDWRIARVTVVLAIAAWGGPAAWNAAHTRMTTVGAAARALAPRASERDLVLVTPWYALVTFERYYQGRAPWMSVPDFDERRFQPYAEFKAKMASSRPMAPVLEKIAATLRSGGSVWLVGALPELAPGEPPGDIAPAPHPIVGWSEGTYTAVWLRQTSRLLNDLAKSSRRVPFEVTGPLFPFEILPITQYEGAK